MRDLYQVRRLLEPAALTSAFPLIDPALLVAMRDELIEAESRYPHLGIEELDGFENQLHVRIVDSSPKPPADRGATCQPTTAARHQLLKHYLGTPTEERSSRNTG